MLARCKRAETQILKVADRLGTLGHIFRCQPAFLAHLRRQLPGAAGGLRHLDGVPVLAYGIRTDFLTNGFPGSIRLLEIAHSLEELKTICRCGRKAMFNGRKIDGKFVFDGEQVAIDGVDVSYESLCPVCYFNELGIK